MFERIKQWIQYRKDRKALQGKVLTPEEFDDCDKPNAEETFVLSYYSPDGEVLTYFPPLCTLEMITDKESIFTLNLSSDGHALKNIKGGSIAICFSPDPTIDYAGDWGQLGEYRQMFIFYDVESIESDCLSFKFKEMKKPIPIAPGRTFYNGLHPTVRV